MIQRFLRIFFVLGGLTMLLPVESMAETPFPTISEPEGEGVECVQPEEEMRRNHMNYILHQRDQTVHDGIRTETYSLAKCIDCHVEPNENGEIAGHDEPEHFCNSCHEYASVQIDCFECHADRPQKYIQRSKKKQDIREELNAALTAEDSNGGDQ